MQGLVFLSNLQDLRSSQNYSWTDDWLTVEILLQKYGKKHYSYQLCHKTRSQMEGMLVTTKFLKILTLFRSTLFQKFMLWKLKKKKQKEKMCRLSVLTHGGQNVGKHSMLCYFTLEWDSME